MKPAPGTPAIIGANKATANGKYALTDLGPACNTFSFQVILGGGAVATGGTVKLQGSLDGQNFIDLATFTIGTDSSGAIKTATGTPVQFVQTVIASLTGGTAPTVSSYVAGY